MGTLNKRERAGAGLAAGSVLLVGGSVAASSLLAGYPVLGGQAVRYLAAGLLLAAWTRLQRKPLPRPAGREWLWLAALAAIGLAGCSVLMIQATRVADPASVGVIIGAAPLVIIIVAAITALVFIAWYGAMERLGVDRTGLFNGLIPVTSLAAVTLTGTGTITPPRLLGALAVLAGVLLGLNRARQVSAGTVNQADHSAQPSAEPAPHPLVRVPSQPPRRARIAVHRDHLPGREDCSRSPSRCGP